MKYNTRVRRLRLYSWCGRPVIRDRKVLHLQYQGLVIKSGGSEEVAVACGDYVLIEGVDEERPFVAKLKELYDDGAENASSKHAIVQWFLRYEEVPFKKRKLLGRDPHPQEIFLYEDDACDNDIDAETIIGTVQISQMKPEAPFPAAAKSGNILYVKLSWDGKQFSPLPSGRPLGNGLASDQSLPRPKFYSLDGDAAESRQVTRSASRGKKHDAEIESRHSASKSSHSKERRAPKTPNGTPGVRKQLQLHSSPESRCRPPTDGDAFSDDDFKALEPAAPKRRVAFSGLPDSSPKKLLMDDAAPDSGFVPLVPPKDRPSARTRLGLSPVKAEALRTRTEENDERKLSEKREKVKPKMLQKQETPKTATDSPRRPADDVEPLTPRSRRKAAQVSISLTRKHIRMISEGGFDEADEDAEFVPLKEDDVFSSEDEEEAGSEEKMSPKRSARKRPTPRTPTSSRKSSARTPNKTPVSKAATPKIPERNQPVQKPATVLEEARIRLHVSAVPESLPCREQEYQDVYSFVESKLLDGTGGCMYISGVPGTGKTATVHEVIRNLEAAVDDHVLPPFQFIEINGMKLTDPHQAFVQILKLLTGQKATADHAAALLEKRFSAPASNTGTTVLLVDELDLLWTRKQNVMYSLFDWPTRKRAKLIVLAIANTMDLPERIMMNRVASRLGLTRMSFQPYSHKQLQQIITSRLKHVRAFEEDAIQLVSRKVAALSGDARRCLDICRRATEICEFSSQKGDASLVKMPHVMEALDEMFSSPYVLAIRSASVQEQTFLKAVIAEFRRSGLEEATFQQVYHQYVALCRIEGVQPPSMSEASAVCLRLGASRLLLVESCRNDLYLRVRINVSQDDVMYALREE